MKRFISISVIAAFMLTNVAVAQKIEYTREDSVKVVKLLADARKERKGENAMLYFGKKFVGVPYVAYTLENGTSEHLIVNLRELDCTTFVETVCALALCDSENRRTFSDYCRNLALIRYRDGKMTDYTSRLHYFTWWAQDNERKGIVRDISADVTDKHRSPFTATQTININYMTAHPSSYRQLKLHPEFVSTIRRYERASNGERYAFIPKTAVGDGRNSPLGVIRDGDIVAMLTRKPGLDTTHIGILVWQDGQLHLLNASSLYKKVVIDTNTFYSYMQKQTSQTGIRVFRLCR